MPQISCKFMSPQFINSFIQSLFFIEEVHKWQREHIEKDDQSKEGYPLNVIIDPALNQ